MLLMAMADWIALGAFLLSVGVAVAAVSLLVGSQRTRVDIIDKKVNAMSETLDGHVNDHVRHIDERAWDGLNDRLTRIENGLEEIRKYLVNNQQLGG